MPTRSTHLTVALSALLGLLIVAPAGCGPRQYKNGIGMQFTEIKPGTFMMGTPADEVGRRDDEVQHKVKLTKGFMMQTTPVTQAQWNAIASTNHSNFRGDDLPVEDVNWDDAMAYCAALSKKEGMHYRLPTEAEWEYACRAGTHTAFNAGNDENALNAVGWYIGNSNGTTHAVGTKRPNAWGLYDMHGNVWQWCSDWLGPYTKGAVTDPMGAVTSDNRVFRGGSWKCPPPDCRSGTRGGFQPDYRFVDIGFRLVLDFNGHGGFKVGPQLSAGGSPIAVASVGAKISPDTRQFNNSIGMQFIGIKPGTFIMGTPMDEVGREANETRHPVTLTKGFMMQTTPVTQAEWQAVMVTNPSSVEGNNLPVEMVNWNDAAVFCKKLSEMEGKHYRLPTEAEWEYCCRSGTHTAYSLGNGENALQAAGWYIGNSKATTHPVGTKQPNAWGLYDMQGDVWQWCSDRLGAYPADAVTDPMGAATGYDRIIRGGSWSNGARYCRAGFRGWHSAAVQDRSVGFRVVLDLD